ncbi:hypothetical protein AHAS_Ahas20G0298400 [Arachis hypogaea]
MKKFESARASAGSSKASKDASLTPLRTPTMVCLYKKEMQMHSALTPLTEKKRNKTPLDLSSTGKNTASSKWRLLSTENKMRSPMISSPFSLRTEERAARRKKVLNLKKSSMPMRHKKCNSIQNSRKKQRQRSENFAKAFASKQGHYLIFTRKGKNKTRKHRRI